MNAPINLLFDIELAKSRLQEAFKPATASADYRKTHPASRQMERRRTKSNESAISCSLRLPEVRGCSGIGFQAL
jgi:hypothetical protein